MFDSPFAPCPLCGEMVLLDQTQRECAAEHRCGRRECPLADCFTGHDFSVPLTTHGRFGQAIDHGIDTAPANALFYATPTEEKKHEP